MDSQTVTIFDSLPANLCSRGKQMLSDETVQQISKDYDVVLATMRGMKRLATDTADTRYRALDQLRFELQEEMVNLLIQR